ncbi:MAG: hypothetical protein Q8P41_32470 [Pseudomonadota bacterium]|nr:hypothetical protein [Pseudomonadota bacterium]
MDPAWAGEAEAFLDAALEEVAGGSVELLDVECRTSMCWAQVRGATRGDLEATLDALPFTSPWNTQGHVELDVDDPLAVQIWVAREGRVLATRGDG